MLRNILADIIAPQPDMEIVGNGATAATLRETVESTNADVVILASASAPEADAYNEVLVGGRFRRKVIQLLEQGGDGLLHEFRPCCVPLGEMSPPRLLETIRGSVERGVEADR
jgi:hypothetical protein